MGRVFRLASSSSKIAISSTSRFYLVNTKKVNAIACRVLEALGLYRFDLSVQFVEAKTIKSLNKRYRGKNKTTDVLSFPQMEWAKPVKCKTTLNKSRKNQNTGIPESLGDIVISLADAKRNAKDIGHELDRETAFLMVHGILHLCGHDHMRKKEEELMTSQQRKLMRLLADKDHTKTPLWKNCVVPQTRKQRVS